MSEELSGKYSIRILGLSFLTAGVGFALAAFLFFLLDGKGSFSLVHAHAGFNPEIKNENLFQTIPSLVIWLLLIITGITFSAIMIYESVLMFRKMHRVFCVPLHTLIKISIGLLFVIVAMIFLPTYLSTISNYAKSLGPPIDHFNLKIGITFVVYGMGSCCAITGMVMTGNIAFNLRKKLPGKSTTIYYATLHQMQMRFLVLLGVQLTIGILTTAFMRQMHVEMYGAEQKYLTQEAVAVYGIFYTAIAAIFFIPARRELQLFGYRIVDKECGVKPAKDVSWKDWGEEREALIDLLKLKWSLKEISEWAIPILAPLVMSILPEYLKAG